MLANARAEPAIWNAVATFALARRRRTYPRKTTSCVHPSVIGRTDKIAFLGETSTIDRASGIKKAAMVAHWIAAAVAAMNHACAGAGWNVASAACLNSGRTERA